MDFAKVRHTVLNFFKNILPSFLAKNFEISSTKRSKFIGAVIGAATLLLVVFSVKNYIIQEFIR